MDERGKGERRATLCDSGGLTLIRSSARTSPISQETGDWRDSVNLTSSHVFKAGSSHKAAFLGRTQRLEPDTSPAIGSVRLNRRFRSYAAGGNPQSMRERTP